MECNRSKQVTPISLQPPTRRCIALHACPCGFFGDPVKPCIYSHGIVTKYQKSISGPLLARTITDPADELLLAKSLGLSATL